MWGGARGRDGDRQTGPHSALHLRWTLRVDEGSRKGPLYSHGEGQALQPQGHCRGNSKGKGGPLSPGLCPSGLAAELCLLGTRRPRQRP